MALRIDKFIWAVRLSKTRALATELINKKKVLCNDLVVKPAREIRVGDVIKVQKANAWFSYKVLSLTERRVGPPLVSTFINDLTSEEERQKLADYLAAQKAYQHLGTGRPTKKDRRSIAQFMNDDFYEG